MQNDGKLFFIIILNVIVLGSLVVLSNLTYAQEEVQLHEKTLYEITNHTTKQNAFIPVGSGPTAIGINEDTDTIYVANNGNDTVSVINGNNSKIKDIEVGDGPKAIVIGNVGYKSLIYVANNGNDTVSVINGKHISKIKDIEVGDGPTDIDMYNAYEDLIYVANNDASVSVIDGKANKVVAKVMFNSEPFNSGHIECDKNKLTGLPYLAPIKQEFYLWSGSECTAKPNQGFEFASWQENLRGNSTQLINFTLPKTWDSILRDSALDFFHMNPDKPEAILNITKFGASYTANFKALPPPIPSEYLIGLFTIVASTIVGWSIPSIIGWINFRKRARVVSSYHQQIKSNIKDDDRIIDENDIKDLDKLKDDIANDYSKGKISDQQYENMNNEIGALYEEIYNKEISSADGNSGRNDDRFLDILNKKISNAFRKGKINNQQFENIKNEISIRYREVFQKKIDSLNELSDEKRADLLNKIASEMADAYGQGKLNELHYNLLKEKISEVKDDRNITTV